MASSWWKFTVSDGGSHLVRVKNVGALDQEVWLDGVPLEAPPGTMEFTGPAATLLVLQPAGAEWALLVDGVPAARYDPDPGGAAPELPSAVAWWKFVVDGCGTHHLRVTDIGTAAQVVFLDGAPLEAPPGTMAFTGPAGSYLELQRWDGKWVLRVDNKDVFDQASPHLDSSASLHAWRFRGPGGASHELRVANIGSAEQVVYLDGALVPAPGGTTRFTGPGGDLLELQLEADSHWSLAVNGAAAQAECLGGAPAAGGAPCAEASWIFLAPATGAAHQMHVRNIGGPTQEVYLDGAPVEAPAGTTEFTGPGGALLELRPKGHAWALFVDRLPVEDHNGRASTLPGALAGAGMAIPQREVVDTSLPLPQGVSWDADAQAYKANVKVHGRFKCLGEFASAEEAHARYLAAKAEFGL